MTSRPIDWRRSQAVATYTAAAATYGEIGPPIFMALGRRLVELADLRPDMSVLDVGTGRGASLIPAAQRVPDGSAVGIDIAAEMVTRARRQAASIDLHSVAFAVMDGGALGFCSGFFDVLLAAFVVFWLQDPVAAFREAVRVLRPGGRFLSSMTTRDDDRWLFYEELLHRYDQRFGFLQKLSPSNGLNRDHEKLARYLTAAGFSNVEHRFEDVEFRYSTPQEWWASLWTHGSRRPLDAMDADVLASFEAEAVAEAERHADGDGSLGETWSVVFTTAETPRPPAPLPFPPARLAS